MTGVAGDPLTLRELWVETAPSSALRFAGRVGQSRDSATPFALAARIR
jgi:hypothetical protein